jgi:hypothetical protein
MAADYYHGQRTKRDRERVQNAFMSGDLRCTLIYRPWDLGHAALIASGGELTREELVQARAGLLQLNGQGATLTDLQTVSGLGKQTSCVWSRSCLNTASPSNAAAGYACV